MLAPCRKISFFFICGLYQLIFLLFVLVPLGPDNLDNLKKLAEQFHKHAPADAAAAQEDDDNDVPELVAGETFESAANESLAS